MSDQQRGIRKHQFKKGQSGNPNGRPPGQGAADILRYILSREVPMSDPLTKVKVRMSAKEAMLYALWAKAMKGDRGAAQEILDRVDGKVAQPMKITTPGGGLTVNMNQTNRPDLSHLTPAQIEEYLRRKIGTKTRADK